MRLDRRQRDRAAGRIFLPLLLMTVVPLVALLGLAVLAGVGTAGVPWGSIPFIVLILQTVGVTPEGIGLNLGVDRFLDMCRTVPNVTGDLVVATLVARSEGASVMRPEGQVGA